MTSEEYRLHLEELLRAFRLGEREGVGEEDANENAEEGMSPTDVFNFEGRKQSSYVQHAKVDVSKPERIGLIQLQKDRAGRFPQQEDPVN